MRYWLFYGEIYYPEGGINDFKGSYNSFKEAKAVVDAVGERWAEWYQIVEVGGDKPVNSVVLGS